MDDINKAIERADKYRRKLGIGWSATYKEHIKDVMERGNKNEILNICIRSMSECRKASSCKA